MCGLYRNTVNTFDLIILRGDKSNMDYEMLFNSTAFGGGRRPYSWSAEESISVDSGRGWVTKPSAEDERIQVLMFSWYNRTRRDRLKDPDVHQWYLQSKPGDPLQHDTYHKAITQPLETLQAKGVKVEALDLDLKVWDE